MDNNRRFADLLPQFAASNGKLPAYADGKSIFTDDDQRQFNALCESHALPFVGKLWALDLVHYRADGNVVISRTNVLAAAAQFLTEFKDCGTGEYYEVDCFNEARQCFYTHDGARRALINDKGYQAQAILLCAYLTGTRLTPAQRKWLESAANGRYLDDKYSQFPSGKLGTLTPKVEFHGASSLNAAYADERKQQFRESMLRHTNIGLNPKFTAELTL